MEAWLGYIGAAIVVANVYARMAPASVVNVGSNSNGSY